MVSYQILLRTLFNIPSPQYLCGRKTKKAFLLSLVDGTLLMWAISKMGKELRLKDGLYFYGKTAI